MIQRIQTLYLFLAGVLATVFSFVSDYTLSKIGNIDLFSISSSIALLGSGVVAIITIFLYKKRSLQINMIWLSIFMAVAGLGLYVYKDGLSNFYLDWQFYFTVVVVILLFLAKNGVKKDEALIKSSYRLR